ncbi:MbtH family protein [Amycolatopsis nivea]
MFDDTQREFRVVVNDEEQYSIWPSGRELPAGWRPEGRTGSQEDCLAHIDEIWTDLRPLSLRRAAAAETAPRS